MNQANDEVKMSFKPYLHKHEKHFSELKILLRGQKKLEKNYINQKWP